MRARGEPGEGRPIRSQQLLSLCLSLSWSCVVLSGSAGSKEDLPGPWQHAHAGSVSCLLSVSALESRRTCVCVRRKMPQCAVSTCRNSHRKTKGHRVRYHRFPAEVSVRERWVAVCGRQNWFNTTTARSVQNHQNFVISRFPPRRGHPCPTALSRRSHSKTHLFWSI